MSTSKTVVTWAEVRFESVMCSAVFRRMGDMGTISTRGPAGDGGRAGAGAGCAAEGGAAEGKRGGAGAGCAAVAGGAEGGRGGSAAAGGGGAVASPGRP